MATAKETKKSSSNKKNTANTGRKTTRDNNKKQVQTNDDRTMKVIVGLIFIVLGVFLFAAVQFQAAGQL